MQLFAIIGILLSVTAVMVESTCNIYQMTTVQIDFCDYAQVITDLVPGIVSANQLEHCIANMDQDMCRPVNDCTDSENMMAEAMSLLNDILNDNSCTDPCTASPCVHGSCTRLTSQTYSCACVAGYSGTNCAQEIDECASNPCQNGGMCVDGVNSFTCNCALGFEGTHCELNIDDCASNPCQNGGICSDGINSHSCICAPGFDGANCEFNIDECSSSPCVNGECIDGINSFTCTCDPGYGGANCDIDIDECSSNPCVNGMCLDGINSFSCFCEEGYEGTHCELDIDECASNPCVNGVCVDGINSYSCNCEVGYEGTQCEIDINECATNPCLNGGMCVDGINSFTCNCTPGYEGERCDIEINFCEALPCANGGECTSVIGGFTCMCAPGFTGETCELDIDECASQPCQNGQCVDGVDSFTCLCAAGYEGTLCEIDIDECASSPCENGGVCSDSVNGYTCTCSFGFKGTNCENVANVGSGAACYVESDGSDYRGEQSTTVSSYPCQYWANTYPHHISNLEHFLFHNDSNFCRNYAGSGRLAPWCYTGLEEVEWEYCEGIPTAFDACTDKPAIEDFTEQKAAFDAIADYDRAECYTDPTGLDYTGYIGQTEGGFECQRWDVNYPNPRNDANKSKPRHNSILFGSHNYCRNNGQGPDGDTDRPWCWIADTTAGERWGYCDTARYLNSSCPGKGSPHEQDRVGRYPECMLTARGPDYVGNVNTTESGLTCIAWGDLDSSNKYHQLFSTQGNKCRSFDTSDDWGRPWCYVTQTETEKCRVKDHYDQCFEAI